MRSPTTSQALIERYSACANAVRQNIDDTDEAGDADTADLLTEVSRGLDKQLWFLEAHVQEPSGTFRKADRHGERHGRQPGDAVSPQSLARPCLPRLVRVVS